MTERATGDRGDGAGSADDRIRVAVVGLGIGRMHVVTFMELRARYRVVAVCDVDSERASEVAGWLRGVRAVTDPEEIWSAEDVDVVVICTPPALHRAQVEAALRAGKDVVCEKPLVGSVREVDELAAIAAETGRHVMPIFQYRFGNGLQRLKALVDAGVAGRPYVANIDLAWTRGADYYDAPWRGRWSTELGGILTTHAVHLLDMAVLVLGPPVAVWARVDTLVNDVETEDSAVVTLRWAGGALATLSATLGSQVELSRHRFTFEHVTAESGTAPYTNSADPWTFTASPDRATEVAAVLEAHQPATEDYIGQYERYADARTAAAAAGTEAEGDGLVLTRDAPDDHPWHHGLWFTIKYVDDDNFWEEMAPYGVLRHDGRPSVTAHDDGRVELAGTLRWTRGDRLTLALVEHRRLTHDPLDPEGPDGGYAIDLDTTLVPTTAVRLDRTEFTTWGGYGGLTVRGPGDLVDTRLLLDDGSTHQRLTGTPSRWCDLSGTVTADGADAPAGLALLDHPGNRRHPVPFYASTRNETYGDEGWSNFANAAFLWDGPMELAAGEELRIRHRTIVHDGHWGAERLAAEHRAWAEVAPEAERQA